MSIGESDCQLEMIPTPAGMNITGIKSIRKLPVVSTLERGTIFVTSNKNNSNSQYIFAGTGRGMV